MEKRLIKEVLEENGFNYRKVAYNRRIKRKQDVKGYASFYCSTCFHDWSSYSSWITIDVEDPAILTKFKQKCNDCDEPKQPSFTDDEIRRMAEYVVKRMNKQLGSDTWRTPKKELKAPHDSSRCEKCNYGEGPLCSSAKKTLYSSRPRRRTWAGSKKFRK